MFVPRIVVEHRKARLIGYNLSIAVTCCRARYASFGRVRSLERRIPTFYAAAGFFTTQTNADGVRTPSSTSAFNVMLGRQAGVLSRNSGNSKQTTLSFGPPAKRQKLCSREPTPSLQQHVDQQTNQHDSLHDVDARSPLPNHQQAIPDSDAEDEDQELEEPQAEYQQTDLEQALPPIKTDKEAIEEYEAIRSAESSQRSQRLDNGEWIAGKSSIYVDAFNLALDTVLEEESHLFDAGEMKIFDDWRRLDYEVQYLCDAMRPSSCAETPC